MEFKSDVLVQNPWSALEDKADVAIPTATLQVYNHIADYLDRKDDVRGINSASNANMCVKRRQFKRQGKPETPLTPRKMVNFLLGDLFEFTIRYFISEALVGPGKLYSEVNFGEQVGSFFIQGKEIKLYRQKTMSFKLDGQVITGHADGFGKRNSDGEWELIESKSYANWGFQSFQQEGAGDYLHQAHALMMTDECRALGIKDVRFFGGRKETGHLWDRLHHWDEAIAKKVVREFRQANRDDEIVPPFKLKEETKYKKPTGRLIAQFPCSYCPFLKECQGEFEVDWKSDQWGNKSPIYVFKTKEVKDAV
jgi:hypothetical protein